MPAAFGGTILDGTYYQTGDVHYTTATPGPPGEQVRGTGDRLGEADRVDRAYELVDLGVDRRGDPGMLVTECGDRDAVGEIEIAAPVGVDESMTLAVAPFVLEIAAEDGGEMRGGPDG